MKNNSRICCSQQNRFPLSIPPRKSDIRTEKRVRFEDPEAMHAHGPDLDSSVSYDATEVRESIDPKTSEYASFKKLKQDVLHNCCSYPSHKVSGQLKISKSSNHVGADIAKRKYEDFNASIHIKKTSPHNLHPFQSPRHVPTRNKEIPDCMHDCVQKLRTPSVNECPSPLKFDTYQFSSAEYVSSVVSCRHGEIFSVKRQKLQQWIAKTTSPETDELQKGYDCVALLLNRLFPESSTSDQSDGPWLRQAECETKLHSSVFPNKDIQSMQNGNHVRNLMRTEEQVVLDRDASASWCDKLGECNLAKRTVGGSNFHFLDCTAADELRNKERMTDGCHFLDDDSQCWCNKCRYKTPSLWRADDYGKLGIYWENRPITECEQEQRATDWDYFLGNGSRYWCNRPSYKTPSLWQTDDYGKSAICGARTIFACEPEDRVTDRDCFLGSGSKYWCNRPCYGNPSPWQADDYGKLAICVANRALLECEPEERASDRDYFLRSGSQYWCNRPSYRALSDWRTDDYSQLAIRGKDRIILDCHPEEDMFLNDVSYSSWCCRSSDRIFPDWESCEGSGSLAASSVSVSKLAYGMEFSGIDDFKIPHASSSYNSTVDVTSTLDVPSALYNLIRLDRSDCANDFKHPMESSSLFVYQDGNHFRDLSAIDVSRSSFYQHNLGRNSDCNLFSPLICDSWVDTPSYRYQNRDVGTQYFEEPCHTVKSDGTSKNLLPHYSHWLIENMVHERTYPAVEAFLLAHRYNPDLIMANSFGKNYISGSHASSNLLEDRDQLEKSRNREVSDNLIELCSSSLLISPANRSCNPEIHRLTWIGSDGGVLCDNFGSSYM